MMGAIPMPAETSKTAKLRWLTNQPVTVAIRGAKWRLLPPRPERHRKLKLLDCGGSACQHQAEAQDGSAGQQNDTGT